MDKRIISIIAVGVVLVAGTAGIASYVTRESMQPQPAAQASKPVRQKLVAAPQQQPVQPAPPRCDDSNIVGTIAGGAAGGVVGSQLGKGNGKTAATIGGVVGGAYLGNQYIPTRNVTCRQ